MEIKIQFTTIDELEKDVQNFKNFRDRYVNVISGRRDINDDEQELERLGVLSDIQHNLDNLLDEMKQAKEQ